MEQKEKNRRRLGLFLPLLVLPFLTLGFYALGGGRDGQEAEKVVSVSGLDTRLPGAQLKGRKDADKLALYEQAKKDSAARSGGSGNAFAALGWDTSGRGRLPAQAARMNERQINARLAAIRQQINAPPVVQQPGTYNGGVSHDPDMERLEKLLKEKSKAAEPDPELKQLDAMLEKIMAIQHPERVTEDLKRTARPGPDSVFKAIRAEIRHKQKVLSGASVELSLLDTIRIRGQLVPKGQSLFGLCQVVNQRVLIHIQTIRLGTSLLPVDLTVCDLDGMEGIRSREAVTQDALRSGSDNALQGMQFLPFDQTMGTQLAGAGIETAKSLFSKKVKQVKVKLKAGYAVLLRNNKP